MKPNEITKKHTDSISFDETRPILKNQGINDSDGTQIFTPHFIVESMVKGIGEKFFLDFKNTILEPTSGDGAFTCYILQLRLQSIKKNQNYRLEALKAISTIYSIEMNENLVCEQRNNIYSIFVKFLQTNHIQINERFVDKVKRIILTNFILGETNIDFSIKYADDPIGWYIRSGRATKKNNNRIQFVRWKIDDDLNCEASLEDWEDSRELDVKSLGGIFGG
jgi:hypothetical protein